MLAYIDILCSFKGFRQSFTQTKIFTDNWTLNVKEFTED